jgi:hypothetical protein
MYNKGVEFSTRIKWLKRSFKWTTSLIYTVENKVTQLVGLGSEFSTSEAASLKK